MDIIYYLVKYCNIYNGNAIRFAGDYLVCGWLMLSSLLYAFCQILCFFINKQYFCGAFRKGGALTFKLYPRIACVR